MHRDVPWGSGVLETATLAFSGVEVGASDGREWMRQGVALRFGPLVWADDAPGSEPGRLPELGSRACRLLIEGIEPVHLLRVDVLDDRQLMLRFGPAPGPALSTAGDMLNAMGWMEGLDALALDIQGLAIPLGQLRVVLWVDAFDVRVGDIRVAVRLAGG